MQIRVRRTALCVFVSEARDGLKLEVPRVPCSGWLERQRVKVKPS